MINIQISHNLVYIKYEHLKKLKYICLNAASEFCEFGHHNAIYSIKKRNIHFEIFLVY